MDKVKILTDIALDLTAALDARSRYRRLLEGLRRAIPYDAAALMRLEGNSLVIKATVGLAEDADSRHFIIADHPRLEVICKSPLPFVFPSDTKLPDPFDGLLAVDGTQHHRIHSCLGCPLLIGGKLIGLLTADAVDPMAFNLLDHTFIAAIAALAGAEMHTTDLLLALELSAKKMNLIARDLLQEVRRDKGEAMVGRGPSLVHLRREIGLVAQSDFSVLITGETGVGKELVAMAIHGASRRKEQPLLSVNCANLMEALAESELFGHSKGAFTGANEERTGKFELADGGTLFLDEIGELPAAVQAKLLRVLQSGEVEKIGTSRIRKVDVRILAATNRNLEREVAAGRFRADLFHRLNVYPMRVPPLRERLEDLPLLVGYFCQSIQRRIGRGTISLTSEALVQLKSYSWPGNVRELENLLIRAAIKASAQVSPGQEISITPLFLELQSSVGQITDNCTDKITPADTQGVPLKVAVENFKRMLIQQALEAQSGNWAAAARSLGLHRSNLHKLAARLNFESPHSL